MKRKIQNEVGVSRNGTRHTHNDTLLLLWIR